MRKVLIFTAHIEHPERISVNPEEYDWILCADAGYIHAPSIGIRPDMIIGDFDSAGRAPSDSGIPFEKLPAEKDMTDTEAAIDLAVSRGATSITVLGGLGGRFDHTMGNIGMLAKYCRNDLSIELMDGGNRVFMLPAGTFCVEPAGYQYLGLIAYGGPVTGLTLVGTKYGLEDFVLRTDTSRCVSNEITGPYAEITFREGMLLVIQSSDLK